MDIICYCSNKIKISEEWILQDIKNFTSRKLLVAKCNKCNSYHAILSEKRIDDGKIFTDIVEKKLVKKVLIREAQRILNRNYINNKISLNGWIYGHNVEIKNKKGKITQVRQYASDFRKNKILVKKIYER